MDHSGGQAEMDSVEDKGGVGLSRLITERIRGHTFILDKFGPGVGSGLKIEKLYKSHRSCFK